MIEWIEVAPGCVVIATADRAAGHAHAADASFKARAELHRIQSHSSDPFARPMKAGGSSGTTSALLDGVIAFAAREARTAGRDYAPGKQGALSLGSPEPASSTLTRERWAFRLASYFHTTFATRRLLPQVLAAFERAARPELVAWTRRKIREEAGHDELALRDLSELGYNAQALVKRVAPPRAAAWVALFEELAAEGLPVACLGYAHALERLAQARPPSYVAQLEAELRLHTQAEGQPSSRPILATRCLRVHSGAGSDAEHVSQNVYVISSLAAAERRVVALACLRAARIAFDVRLAAEPCPDLGAFRVRPPIAATTAALEHRSG